MAARLRHPPLPARADQTAARVDVWLARPGLRTFRSSHFRLLAGSVVLVLSLVILGSLLARQAALPDGQFGFDFQVYQQAARDLASGRSPYPAQMLDGPVAAQGALLYKYAPPFAQLIVPLAGVGAQWGNAIWAAIQVLLAFAGVWLAGSYGGARPSRERALWTAVAIALYLPVFDSIWKGNVSIAQSFLTALMLGPGSIAGISIGAAILLKTSPAALLPAAVAARQRGLLPMLVLTVAVVIGASFVLAPGAWVDFLAIQPNLATGRFDFATNLAPAAWAQVNAPNVPALATALRAAALALGGVCVIASVVLARRLEGWPAAVICGTVAALIIPGATWYHYLAILLPFAAFAWPRAGVRGRFGLAAGAGAVSIGIAALPLTVIGGVLLTMTALAVVWPRTPPTRLEAGIDG